VFNVYAKKARLATADKPARRAVYSEASIM